MIFELEKMMPWNAHGMPASKIPHQHKITMILPKNV
jgi:hypothetical protein